jgi:hypothetical protein
VTQPVSHLPLEEQIEVTWALELMPEVAPGARLNTSVRLALHAVHWADSRLRRRPLILIGT